MEFLSWVWIGLILIPLGDFCCAIYWTTLVAKSIFVAAVGSGRIVLSVLILVATGCASVFAFVMFKQGHSKLVYSRWTFHVWTMATVIGFILCAIAVMATSTESQKVCATQISSFVNGYPADGRVISFLQSYTTTYSRLRFEYSYGQVCYEGFLILTCAWAAVVVSFLGLAELA
jgi:hypothetical protein